MVNLYKTDGGNLREVFEKIFIDFPSKVEGKFLVKPNFSGRPPLIDGENTDPQFLKELIEFLVAKGAEEVAVIHGALLGTQDKVFPFDKIIDEGGFAFLRSMPKTKIIDLDKEPTEILEYEGSKFIVPTIIKEYKNHINLAKLKTHMEATVSLALKNQMGLVSMGTRVAMHKGNLENDIAYLGKLIRPTLNIVDGIVAMEGNGPHHGQSKRLDTVFAGDDMVELDSAISNLIGLDFKKINHIVKAENIGVGKFPVPEILEKFKDGKFLDFKLAMKFERFGKNFYAWPTYSCSRCITALNEFGRDIKKHPIKNIKFIKKAFVGNKKIHFVIGRADDLSLSIEKGDTIISIGNCSKNFSQKCGINCLDKCPPTVKETREWIENSL